MNEYVKKGLLWVKSIWSEPSGNGSSTRIHISALTAFIIAVGLAFAVATYKAKFTMDQFNSFLVAGGTFILTTCGPLYGANKLADWGKNRDNVSNRQDDKQ